MQGNPASFVANSTLQLGSYNKPLDAATSIFVDYSQLTPPVNLTSYSFKIRPGGSPQLSIFASEWSDTGPSLVFTVYGGIAGRSYQITINGLMSDNEVRSDYLTVNVLGGDDCGCAMVLPPPPTQGAVSGDGSIIVNTAPRFFVSATAPVAPNVLDRWYDSSTGNIFDFVTNGLLSYWEEATVGGGGGYGAQVVTISPITPDGITTDFTMTAVDGTDLTIPTSNTLLVSVDGVWQQPDVQFAASGDEIGFAEPPSTDSVVFMLWLSPPPDTPPAPGP